MCQSQTSATMTRSKPEHPLSAPLPSPQGRQLLARGRYRLRLIPATAGEDLARAQDLRALCFGLVQRDADAFDASCLHLLVEEAETGQLVSCCRLSLLRDRTALLRSYTGTRYDLSRLTLGEGSVMELGRFCIHPDWRDADILRLAWGALTQLVDEEGVGLLLGCSSFAGVDPGPYAHALAQLSLRHQPPGGQVVSPQTAERRMLRDLDLPPSPDPKLAALQMPALLRTYLMMGGWVGDHLVVDRALNTQHIFTAVDIAAIPDNRKRLLRAVSATG